MITKKMLQNENIALKEELNRYKILKSIDKVRDNLLKDINPTGVKKVTVTLDYGHFTHQSYQYIKL